MAEKKTTKKKEPDFKDKVQKEIAKLKKNALYHTKDVEKILNRLLEDE